MTTATSRQPAAPDLSIEALETGTVDPGRFDHEAHVYTAWLYLQRFETLEAIEKYSAALRRLTMLLGVETKYHQTITWFFLLLIAERRGSAETDNWLQFKARNEDLFCSDPSIFSRYYSSSTLESDFARTHFVLPDPMREVRNSGDTILNSEFRGHNT